MSEAERLQAILNHLHAASKLAEEAWSTETTPHQALREAAHKEGRTLPVMPEISMAFNALTANLLRAGMPLSPGNVLELRLHNAINHAMVEAMKQSGDAPFLS